MNLHHRTPAIPPGAGALIIVITSIGLTAAILLLGRQFSGRLAGHLSVVTVDRRCSGSVNRWANHRLESYRQQLIAEQHGNQTQDDSQSAIRVINWFDHLITDRMLDKQRQEITATTLRTSQCRPVFQ